MSPRDLLTHPLWRPEDLGAPIPDSPHATSVCMPTWDAVLAYERGDAAFRARLRAGYPRFVFHPITAALFAEARARHAAPGEDCLVLPDREVALAGAAWIGPGTRLLPFAAFGLWLVCFPAAQFPRAKAFWQHRGEIVSSRLAEDALAGAAPAADGGTAARADLATRLAALYGCAPDDVLLYPSGMAAVAAASDLLATLCPGATSLQLGFPYVDVYKVQQHCGNGVEMRLGEASGPAALRERLAAGPVAGLFCEVPGNPLLSCPNLIAAAPLIRAQGGVVVVDDTLSGPLNTALLPHADLIVTSLTKYLAGRGDVMAGALIISPQAAARETLQRNLRTKHRERLWWRDAAVLAGCLDDYPRRMARFNASAASLVARLRAHPLVELVHYPDDCPIYARLRRSDGGYGGLCSIILREAERRAPAFFDALPISKGPSLGTDFSLACPYTLLAHFDELDWAEACGLSPWLVRLSVGLEDPDELWRRCEVAFAACDQD